MPDFSREIALAVRMIAKYGGDFTFTRQNTTIADTDKPWRKSDGGVLTYTATAVMLEFKKTQQSQGFTAGSEDARAILPGDMIIYLAPGNPDVTFSPQARDVVTLPGKPDERYGVVDNMTLSPDGATDILYKLWVRK